MGQETASDMSGWWRKHQVGVTRKHRRWAERKRNHVSLIKGDYIGLQKNSRGNFGVSGGNTKRCLKECQRLVARRKLLL